jgi:C4-dicarboxylate-specific signal transduction histidine kinase
MTDQPSAPARARPSLLPVATGAVAAVVFVADTLTPPDCVVGGLYVLVVLMAGQFVSGRRLWLIALGCAGLTILAQFLAHRYVLANDQAAYIGAFNTTVTILAVGLSCSLVLRGRSAEIALRRAQTDLAHVSRVTTMGELTASIAHEVNQPIAGVVTNAGACLRWLAGDTPDVDKARAAATRIVRDGNRAAEIISRIRQIFTKGGSQRGPVNLNLLVRETLELLNNEAARYSVTVRTDLAADIPTVLADRVQLQQVLVNLILNGVDAMREVAGTRELVLASRRSEDGQIALSVSDTGVGLPPEATDQLFEAFFTTKAHGTGMGLSISRSIIEAHQGRLWATPNAPRGAIFHFALPTPAETAQNGTQPGVP